MRARTVASGFSSTLRKYVEALGGDLDVVALFNDKRVRLRGV